MANSIIYTGRLAGFEGKYTPAEGEKKSRMNWAINAQINSKNEAGYYDEIPVNFTAWGYYADQLQQINSLAKDEPLRKECANVTLVGKVTFGYKNKEGQIINGAQIDVAEVIFNKRLQNSSSDSNTGDNAFAPKTSTTRPGPGPAFQTRSNAATARPTAPTPPVGRPAAPTGVPVSNRAPRFS